MLLSHMEYAASPPPDVLCYSSQPVGSSSPKLPVWLRPALSPITHPEKGRPKSDEHGRRGKGDPVVMTNLLYYMHRGGGLGKPVVSTSLIAHNDLDRKVMILLLSDFSALSCIMYKGQLRHVM